MRKIVKEFDKLSAQEINAMQPGKWGDYELLDVLHHFSEMRDEDRAEATRCLILRSPEHTEMVSYDELFWDQVNHWQDHQSIDALQWIYAHFTYVTRHESGFNIDSQYRDLVEMYLRMGDIDTALRHTVRLYEMEPDNIWIANAIAFTLNRAGCPVLAIELFEQGLQLTQHDDHSSLQGQLERGLNEAKENAAQGTDRTDEVDPELLKRLRTALQVQPSGNSGLDGYLPPVSQLIDLEDQDPQAAYAEISKHPKVYAAALIRLANDKQFFDTHAAHHASTLLQKFQQNGLHELDLLEAWLQKAKKHGAKALYSSYIGKVEGYTTEEIKEFAEDTTRDKSVRISAIEGLGERAENLPEQREFILDTMRNLLTRPEAHDLTAEETIVAFAISETLDLSAKELYPEIKAAYDEDRVDTAVVEFDSVVRKWGMEKMPSNRRRDDGLNLRLRCLACDRERVHFVQHVTLDVNTQELEKKGTPIKFSPYVMDREIVCPKCGATDQYEMTPQASLALIAQMDGGFENISNALSGNSGAIRTNPRVNPIRSMAMGREMHPLEAINQYQKLIAKNPANSTNYMKKANLLRTIHRNDQALETYRQAYEIDPDNADVMITAAMAEHDYGDQEQARELYEAVKSAYPIKQMFSKNAIENSGAALEGLRALSRGESSPWGIQTEEESTTQNHQRKSKSVKRKKSVKPHKQKKKKKRKRK